MIRNMVVAPLNYGVLNECCGGRFMGRLKASQTFYQKSGKFVSRDTSAGYFDVTAAADTQIMGWANVPSIQSATGWTQAGLWTGSASVAEYVDIFNDINARFLMPSSGTPLEADVGRAADIAISTYQQCNVDASSTEVLVVYDFNATLSLVEVGLNPVKMHTLGVTE
jgi:hypothetical protein